jgi:hypothetical protein
VIKQWQSLLANQDNHEKVAGLGRDRVLQGDDKMAKEQESDKHEKAESSSKEVREEFIAKKKSRKSGRGGNRK